MAKKTVDIAAMLGKQFANVPESGTAGREQLRYIGIGQLDDDPNNFYSVDGLEELAGNIELCGLQQPIRVREMADGRYTIVSGHRRRAALRKLVDEGREQYREIPCIVEREEGVSPAMAELRLIYANADTRQLSSADIAKQAERVETLLYQLKEEGVAFPGRMRDHVAQACKISKSKLARLKVIRENLIPLWAGLYGKNEIAEDTAYELARLGEDYQLKLYQLRDGGSGVYAGIIRAYAGALAALDAIQCPNGADCCSNADHMWQRLLKRDDAFKNCDGRYGRTAACCKGCPALLKCKYACPAFAEEIAAAKAKQKEGRKAEKTERQAKAEARIAAVAAGWARLGQARKLARMEMADLVKAICPDANKYDLAWRVERWTEYERGTGITETSQTLADCLSGDGLLRAADALRCSTDYLLGRADDPRPFAGAWIGAAEETPEEGRFLFVCDAFGNVQPSVYWNGGYMDAAPGSLANRVLPQVRYWMYQPALPGGMKRCGQETLDNIMKHKEAFQ